MTGVSKAGVPDEVGEADDVLAMDGDATAEMEADTGETSQHAEMPANDGLQPGFSGKRKIIQHTLEANLPLDPLVSAGIDPFSPEEIAKRESASILRVAAV